MRTKLIAAAVATALTMGIVGPAVAHDNWNERSDWQRREDWRRHQEWQRQREWERQRAWEHRREIERQRAIERERAAYWRHRGHDDYTDCHVRPRNFADALRQKRDC